MIVSPLKVTAVLSPSTYIVMVAFNIVPHKSQIICMGIGKSRVTKYKVVITNHTYHAMNVTKNVDGQNSNSYRRDARL